MPNEFIPQGTDAWKAQRLGKATASRIQDAVARIKTGWGASRANYAAELIAERLTGVPAATYTNAAMQWGTEKEPEARAAYTFFTGRPVIETGFIEHPTIPMSGCSPDGIVEDYGLIEIKAPNTANHIDRLLGEPIEKRYMTQMMWQMACTGRQWADFCSFDPRLPIDLQLKVIRITRDDSAIAGLEKEVLVFLDEVAAKVDLLNVLSEAA